MPKSRQGATQITRFSGIFLAIALSITSIADGLCDPVPTVNGMKAFALQWFARMQAANIDRTQYTAAYGVQLTDDAVQAMSHQLNQYGRRRSAPKSCKSAR